MAPQLTRGPRSPAELDRDWTWTDMMNASQIIDAIEAAQPRED